MHPICRRRSDEISSLAQHRLVGCFQLKAVTVRPGRCICWLYLRFPFELPDCSAKCVMSRAQPEDHSIADWRHSPSGQQRHLHGQADSGRCRLISTLMQKFRSSCLQDKQRKQCPGIQKNMLSHQLTWNPTFAGPGLGHFPFEGTGPGTSNGSR